MKPFTTFAAILFGLIALAHAYRLVMGCDIVVSGHPVPMWISLIGTVVAGALAILLWREARLR